MYPWLCESGGHFVTAAGAHGVSHVGLLMEALAYCCLLGVWDIPQMTLWH